MAAGFDAVGHRVRQRLSGRDVKLRGHDVDAGDQLGHRVLDLDSGVHLQEVEGALGVEKELDGAGAYVVHGFGGAHRGLAHPPAQVRVDYRRGSFLDDLLVSPLKGTLPFSERHDAPVAVAEDLDLDVARTFDEALDVDGGVVEARAGLRGGAPERGLEFLLLAHQAHALAAAAGGGL